MVLNLFQKLLGVKVVFETNNLISCFLIKILNPRNTINMNTYNNLVEATNGLMKRGYTENLSLEGDTVDDKAKKIKMKADEFEIDEFYRFEGASNPSDMSIVYAVTSRKYNLKGVLINAFGMYANNSPSAIEAKLHHYQVGHKL